MIKPLSSAGDGESGNELWAPFPLDILTHIASKLTAADYASARAACKSWRAVFSSVAAPHRPHPLPFLLLPPHYTIPDPLRLRSPTPPSPNYPLGPIVRFPRRLNRCYTNSPIFPLGSLRNPTFRPLPSLSDTARHVCVGSSHGWLILLGPTSHISLLNPLTADTIPLPPPLSSVRYLFPVSDARDVDQHLLFRFDPPRRLRHLAALLRLAALSADPSDDPSSFILVIVLGNDVSSRFFTCGPSDGYAAWKPHSQLRFPAYGLTDLIFHRGRCFAAVTWNYSGRVLHGPVDAIAVFDFHAYPAFQRLFHVRIRENYLPKNYANFLIESAGKLLLVTRHGEINTGRILVHRLPPLEGDGPFVPTPEASLGNRALFLGTGNSVLVQARDFRRIIRRNCVYFTDVYRKVVNDRAVSVGCIYVFDMEKGITRKAFEVAEEHEMNMWSNLRPWWVTPNLRRRDP